MKCRFPSPRISRSGFSLIELLTVIVIMGALLAIGMSLFGKTAGSARRTGTDQFVAAIDQARSAAITRRKPVLLAIAPPSGEAGDDRCRYGLFEVDELPEAGAAVNARQIGRWNLMPSGVVFLPGQIEGLRNLLDEDEFNLSWKDGRASATVRAFAFNPRGGLAWPAGSDPVSLKIATGVYKNGKATPVAAGGNNTLRVGRVVARPWRLDG